MEETELKTLKLAPSKIQLINQGFIKNIGRYPKPKYSTALNLARVLNLALY